MKDSKIKQLHPKDELEAIAQTINIEDEMKVIRPPKYIKIPFSEKSSVKVLTPKKIVAFKYENGSFLVFGDARCSPKFTKEKLKGFLERELAVVMFRTPKKEKQVGIPVSISEILKSRKHRLAVAMVLPDENENDWMREQLDQWDNSISDDDLKEEFLSSLKHELIIDDLKRIIHLYYQQTR